MLLLFQCLTGDDWSMVMDDAMVTPERGCSYEDGNCGSPLAVPYFVSFLLLGTCALHGLEHLQLESADSICRLPIPIIQPGS